MVGREKWTDFFFLKAISGAELRSLGGLFWNKEESEVTKLQMTPRSLVWVGDW